MKKRTRTAIDERAKHATWKVSCRSERQKVSMVDEEDRADKPGTVVPKVSVVPDTSSSVNKTGQLLICPHCRWPCEPGDPLCKRCGWDLTVSDDETLRREDVIAARICPECGRDSKPGQIICAYCGHLFDERPGLQEAAVVSFTCPKCGKSYREGDPVCLGCGYFLQSDTVEETYNVSGEPIGKPGAESRFPGALPSSEETPIIFEIEGAHLILPAGEALIIGRRSSRPADVQPDVDLGAFAAHEKGVSRQHIVIKRRGTLAYVTDIGSANGTWLNGRRLMPNAERLLRHGDVLALSHLRVKILYSL